MCCRFHKIKRKRLERLQGGKEVTEEELVKLRAKVSNKECDVVRLTASCSLFLLSLFLQERMTLKHSSKAKWAKKQHIREHRDPAVSDEFPVPLQFFLVLPASCALFSAHDRPSKHCQSTTTRRSS